MHRQKTIISIACLLILVAAAAFLVSPYIVIRKARQAAENGDTEALLAHYVDYSAVQTSVEKALVSMALQEMGIAEHTLSELDTAVLGLYVYPVAQQMASPSAVAAMLSGRAPDFGAVPEPDVLIKDKALITMRYQGLNRFAVILSDYENAPQSIAMIFRRKGLSWQMKAIVFQGI